MRCVLIAATELCVIDARTNNLSLINLLQDINSPTFPVVLPKLALAVILDRQENEQQQITTSIRMAIEETQLFDVPFQIDFQGRLRVRAVADMQGVLLPRPGVLKASLHYENAELGAWTLSVNQIGTPPEIFVAPDDGPPVPAA